eukprot:1161334-Pelagomonas_calceolata.AAC.2
MQHQWLGSTLGTFAKLLACTTWRSFEQQEKDKKGTFEGEGNCCKLSSVLCHATRGSVSARYIVNVQLLISCLDRAE